MKVTLKMLSGVVLVHFFVYGGIALGGNGEVGQDNRTKSADNPVKTAQHATYTVAEENYITTADGVSGNCYSIFSNVGNVKKICDEFYTVEKNEYDECYRKRVDGTETEGALKAIDKVCNKKSNSKAWKAVEWYLEKQKFENYFSSDQVM